MRGTAPILFFELGVIEGYSYEVSRCPVSEDKIVPAKKTIAALLMRRRIKNIGTLQKSKGLPEIPFFEKMVFLTR